MENIRQRSNLFGPRELWGLYVCPACPARNKRALQWPQDAYYQVEVRGETLWAWTRDQTIVLRDFLAAEARETKQFPPAYDWFLRHVPNHFLLVKHRKEAVKKLEKLIAAT